MPLPNPVIVVPGITATYLRDQYPTPPDIVWAVIEKSYERAALHPDDLSKIASSQRVLEAQQPARVVSDQLYEIAYKELIEELRFNLREKEDQPVPVYGFGYVGGSPSSFWRRSWLASSRRLSSAPSSCGTTIAAAMATIRR